jgi:hypothetical protein
MKEVKNVPNNETFSGNEKENKIDSKKQGNTKGKRLKTSY